MFEDLLKRNRKKIDLIDIEILSLLKKRVKIIKDVRKIKINYKDKFFIKSAREADMIKNLIKKSSNKLRQSLIVDIWRKIITSSNILEQNIKVGIYNPKKIIDYHYIARDYYSGLVEIVDYLDFEKILHDFKNEKIQILICDLENLLNFEKIDYARIFAKIPFIKNDFYDQELFLIANKKPEKSSSDNSLILIESYQDESEKELISILKKYKIKAEFLRKNKNQYLLELKGFFDNENKNLQKFIIETNLKIKILGNYPLQIIKK